MRITPRKDEVQRLVSILTSDDYDNPEQMAKALLKESADILWMRDWYALGSKLSEDSPHWLPFGPFASESEALQTFKKVGFGGAARTVKLYSPGRLLAFNEGKDWPGYCKTCKHDQVWHLQDGSARGGCVSCEDCLKFKK
ncbi:hypothetical protein O7614_26875 [Micromonospora sp. WMMD961]|uniref:hypothetical protein n=1 Tax=Micromonospora sp. WMMD961 TaxID=3016100 RepID=UPI0024165CF1|nr:hypothetical protein [Micromonospora sp. WMMD961]MDG4783287.1 hypothetical protein [Micromonospora sp. WMMD961]